MIEIRESFDWCFKISLSKEMRNKKAFTNLHRKVPFSNPMKKKRKTPDTEGKQANKVENDIVKKDRRLRTLQICHMNMKF